MNKMNGHKEIHNGPRVINGQISIKIKCIITENIERMRATKTYKVL